MNFSFCSDTEQPHTEEDKKQHPKKPSKTPPKFRSNPFNPVSSLSLSTFNFPCFLTSPKPISTLAD
ncbi:hypothetical protein GmHk_03G006277 [Glycine max]|nr:hypothetical protein GmHk_03G006277 [Glycine max]